MPEEEHSEQTIRAFIAIPVPKSVKEKIETLQTEMKNTGAKVKWVNPKNMHLTVVFLGQIPQVKVTPLSSALDIVAQKVKAFPLTFRGLDFFGSPRSPKVVWIGLEGDLQTLIRAHDQIRRGVQQLGIKCDTRPYKPHLTLGRVRARRNAEKLLEAISAKKDVSLGEIEVREIRLIQSRLGSTGPIYTPLHTTTLG